MTSPTVRLVAASLVLGVIAAGTAQAGATPADPTAAPRGHGHGHAPSKGKVVWDSTVINPGTPIAAHGRVPGGKRQVKLQVKLPGRWQSFGKAKSSRNGKFAVTGALDWYGVHKIRVATSGRHAFKRSTSATVVVPYAARGNAADHVFTTGEKGLRYSFSPCKTIHYVVNADDVGPAGITMAQIGMSQMSYATGIKVKYVGTSHEIAYPDQRTKLPKGQDFLISWADEAEVPEFVSTPAIGFGGPDKAYRARDGKGRKILMSTQAGVVLDTTAYNSGIYTQGYFGTKPAWGEVILHEIGHAMGLAHVQATDEIMYPGAGRGPYPDGSFQGLYDAGDLAALATNGLGQGCFHKVRSFGGHHRTTDRVSVPAKLS